MDVLFFIIGTVVGATLGAAGAWLLAKARAGKAETLVTELRRQAVLKEDETNSIRQALDTERQLRAEAAVRLEEASKRLDEDDSRLARMKETFQALSASALKSSSEDFLRLASERLGKISAETKGKLSEHQNAITGIVKPLSEALQKYQEMSHSLELKRKQDHTSLDEQIKMLAATHLLLQKETGNLVSALRKPHVRGRWGEVTLKNVVELAGMSSHCDFTEQLSIDTEAGRLRPDMVIHLPGKRDIIVDSKVSMEALLDAASAETDEEKKEALKRHTMHVKEHITRLGGKNYWSQFERSPELVVLFMGEAALTAALEADNTIMEDSMSKKVLLATPTTLFALLTAVAYGWRQESIAKNAEMIAAIGKELYDRAGVWSRHINEIGTSLTRAVDAYNRSVSSMDTRLLPTVRKFKELGATAAEDIPALKQVEQIPRQGTLPTEE